MGGPYPQKGGPYLQKGGPNLQDSGHYESLPSAAVTAPIAYLLVTICTVQTKDYLMDKDWQSVFVVVVNWPLN